MGFVLPPEVYVEDFPYPLIYLAGPSLGSGRWEPEALYYLLQHDVAIAAPRQAITSDYFDPYVLSGKYVKGLRAWEDYHLQDSLLNGVALFWLPGESSHSCEKVHARISVFELGIALGQYRENPDVRFVVGSDGDFSELLTVRKTLEGSGFGPVYASLEETCDAAVRLL